MASDAGASDAIFISLSAESDAGLRAPDGRKPPEKLDQNFNMALNEVGDNFGFNVRKILPQALHKVSDISAGEAPAPYKFHALALLP